MRVHLVGVSGTGMGSLAILFRDAGHEVSGSDVSFDPPIGPALREAKIATMHGFDVKNLSHAPDLVVVGNAIRRDNVEALEAQRLGLTRASMSSALRDHFLRGRRPLVVAGTHGKTTTASMCAWILASADREPGYFIGGLPKNFPTGAAIGRTNRKLATSSGAPIDALAPFVVEGDEYDSVYWHKAPKFLDYIGIGDDDVAIITSVEHDHIDIYPDAKSYETAFREFVRNVPKNGLIVCDASHERARVIVQEDARCRVAFYALEGDKTGDATPTWLGAIATPVQNTNTNMHSARKNEPAIEFDLYAGGVAAGRTSLRVPGAHNVRNAMAAIAACAEGFNVPLTNAKRGVATFDGVQRRQDLIGEPGGVRIYDDFAHHPTAVNETLRALRARHPSGALWAVFEPRSATACRNLHQAEYARAFAAADHVIFAPLGRANIPEGERLDVAKLANEIGAKATAAASIDAVLDQIVRDSKSGDTVALLSNGAFGGAHGRLIEALHAREKKK